MFLPPKRRLPPNSPQPPVDHLNGGFNSPVDKEPIETINLADDSIVSPPASPAEPETDQPIAITPKKKFHITKKQWLIIAGTIAVLLIAAGLVYWFVLKPAKSQPAKSNLPVATKTSPAAPMVSPLTGEAVSNIALTQRQLGCPATKRFDRRRGCF